jgi:hypothetical protein
MIPKSGKPDLGWGEGVRLCLTDEGKEHKRHLEALKNPK